MNIDIYHNIVCNRKRLEIRSKSLKKKKKSKADKYIYCMKQSPILFRR